jgi:hypothetical protein
MILVLSTANVKLGNVSCTYAPIRNTCPDTCKLKGSGCYAESGNVALHMRRAERLAGDMSPDDCAILESSMILEACAKRENIRPLRLHVSGDTATAKGARSLAHAAHRWGATEGRPVWTYTHAWRMVHRAAWGVVSVLASCETDADAQDAASYGYAPAIVVPAFPSERAFQLSPGGTRYIPCPAQTRDNVTCASCRLCWDSDRLLRENRGIAFAAHGSQKKRILNVIK